MSIRARGASIVKKLVNLESQLTIKAKIRALFLTALVLCLIIAIPLLYFGSASFMLKLQKNSADTIVNLISVPLTEGMEKIDLIAIDRVINRVKTALSVSEICLFNRDRVLIKSFGSDCQLAEIPYLHSLTSQNDKSVGYLYLLPKNKTRDITLSAVSIAFCLIAIYFLISFFLLARLQKVITRPLESLSQAVSNFSDTNDFHIRAQHNSDDEIGRLAQSFNNLLQDMRKKEHALIRAKNLADEANELKGDFLASVSHEIRTPMNGIIGTAELLLESLDNQKHKNYTSTILRSSESLLAIINDILDFSKIESGKLDIENIPFNLHSEVEDVADLMAIKAIEKGLEIITSISPYIPSHVIGDPSRLRQIITNLVNNAIKFTQSGHVRIEVEPVGCHIKGEKSESLRFSVVDTGIGISEQAQSKIFERFTQAESSITRQYGGTGLGLAICKQLIELMGGEIFVESVEGKGSTFSFILRFLIDENETESDEPDHLEGIRVLVVDDNPYFREHIKTALRFYGMRVVCTENAKEALQALSHSPESEPKFDILIIDENMPVVNGCSLAEKIMLTYVEQAPPIVILNDVNADIRQEQFYTRVGISACMQKPVRTRQLISLIDLTLSEDHSSNNGQLLSIDEIRKTESTRGQSLKLAGPHIMVAEENDIHYKFISDLLRSAGAHIARTRDGNEAVQYAANNCCDLIIISSGLPKVDSLDTAVAIKKMNAKGHSSNLPIIIAATENNESNQVKSIGAGVDAFLPKALIKNQLLNKVAVLLPKFVVDNHNTLVKFDGVTVLLVEDNRVNAQITTEILTEFGCEVELCSDGKAGLEMVKLKHFDVVLMDCQMPIMDGFESTRHIRHYEQKQNKPHTPIVALTANAMKGDNERCYSAGMDDYITKPIKREKLRQVLTDYIDPKKICVSNITEDKDNVVLMQDHFKRFSNMAIDAEIQVDTYVSDIERSLKLLQQQYIAQPPKIVYETAQTIASICTILGFNRLHAALSHLAKSALALHADHVAETSLLTPAICECERAYKLTLNQVVPLLPKSPAMLEPSEEVIMSAADLPQDPPPERLIKLTKNRSSAHKDLAKKKGRDCPENLASSENEQPKLFVVSGPSQAETIDQNTFDITQNIFKDKFSKILEEYFEDTNEYINTVLSGVKDENFERIREAAHPLKSSSFTLGLSGMGEIAKKIELLAKKRDSIKDIESLAELLRPEYKNTQQAVSQLMMGQSE